MTDPRTPDTTFNSWIPFAVAECRDCSALIRDDYNARLNHERWHAMNPLPKAGIVPGPND